MNRLRFAGFVVLCCLQIAVTYLGYWLVGWGIKDDSRNA